MTENPEDTVTRRAGPAREAEARLLAGLPIELPPVDQSWLRTEPSKPSVRERWLAAQADRSVRRERAAQLGVGLAALAVLIGLVGLGFAYASTWTPGPDSARWATSSFLTFIAALPPLVGAIALTNYAWNGSKS
jgi:hypothetical protein